MFLDRIVTQTRQDLEQRKREKPLEEIKRLAFIEPPPRDLLAAIRPGERKIGLIAEVKGASPSKGVLVPDLDPVDLAFIYEEHGASAISVVTEPRFFSGSLAYLTKVKQAVNIPVLCKDFIIDEYQVYEARAWDADAILLICAILDDAQLRYLLRVARDLGMRCLVEVHTAEEARRAVAAGARIIGINSRDLDTFQMNPALIRELRPLIPEDRVVVAESGIRTEADARRVARYDIQAMLVGESLVTASDIPAQMRALLKGARESTQVKICGLSAHEHLDTAIEAGADMLGLVFHKPSHRYILPEQARTLLATNARLAQPAADGASVPDIVGVFVNEDAAFINEVAEAVGLHFVQLHGNESPEFCQDINRPVIKAIRLGSEEDRGLIEAYRDVAWRILLDTPSSDWGGTGMTHDWSLARSVARRLPILLAGGLTPENVGEAIRQVHPWGVDVSSGVETNKQKDLTKIRAFVANARLA